MRKSTAIEASPEKFQGWGKLEPLEQSKLTVAIQALEKAVDAFEMTNLEVGEHLDNISRLLTPKRQFNKWLMWWLSTRRKAKSRSWAYQTLREYQDIKASTPHPVLEMAKQQGTKLTADVLLHNPPPKTEDRGKIAEYLSTLRPTRVEVVKSPDMLLKECVNFVSIRWNQLPNNHKSRTAFAQALIGMLLGRFGIASTQTFSPMAVPDTFRAQRGRRKAA